MKKRNGSLPIILLLVAAPYLAWEAFEYQFHLNLLPRELGAWRISASITERWGFGPGGNETGVIVYSLPEPTAAQIAKEGLAFFRRTRRRAYEWHSTPVQIGPLSLAEIRYNEGMAGFQTMQFEAFLNRYGFGIKVPSWVSDLANQAITSPNSFFSYGPGGRVTIVIPAEHRIVLAYAG